MPEMTAAEAEQELYRISRVFDTTGACSFAAALCRRVASGELAEVAHGQWKEGTQIVWDEYGSSHVPVFTCSNCGYEKNYTHPAYCSSCGALMDGKDDEDAE